MTISELAKAIKSPGRRIRYALDHNMVPGLKSSKGRGRERVLRCREAIEVAVAVRMLEAGLTRSNASKLMKAVHRELELKKKTSRKMVHSIR